MAGTNDRVLGQSEDLFAIVLPGVTEGDYSPSHRSGKNRIPHHRKWTGEPFDEKGRPTFGMSARSEGRDLEAPDGERIAGAAVASRSRSAM